MQGLASASGGESQLISRDAPPWNFRPIDLKYRLGEVPLFSIRFAAAVLERHWSTLEDNLPPPRPSLDTFSSVVKAVYMNSYPVKSPLPVFTRFDGLIRYVPRQYKRSIIDFRDPFDVYIRKFSAKSRSALVRKVRKFAQFSGGEAVWREYSSLVELKEFHRLASEISKKTYHERLLGEGLPSEEAFLEAVSNLLRCEPARGYILFHQESPIAYLYCPSENGYLLYTNLAYDPKFSAWSPGTVLLYLVLERNFRERKFHGFDFCEGSSWYKELFSTRHITCADIYYFPFTLKSSLILALHSGLLAVSRTIVSTLDFIGARARVKRWIRRTW